eukprot:gnl/TRDRNA2_/TRDRNA2_169081_c1_seq5.p1 gnl/TRDRNA2_/TRDRNA2_169081_c1~~gnl/TRDRNA2_/TRDRNA2_169081_c1_seq5.p1  ORF type:complete len:914 (+),score=160.47 gnl/TRDRNA2_/TRDRNA2_169081_c1_seq5:302-2743(+)
MLAKGSSLQEMSQRVVKQLEAMAANPVLQDLATLLAELIEAEKVDPHSQMKTKLTLEQLQAISRDPHLQKWAKLFLMHLEDVMSATMQMRTMLARTNFENEAMKTDPIFQEHLAMIAKQMMALQDGHTFPEVANRFAELVEGMQAEPHLREHMKRIAEQIDTLMADGHLLLAERAEVLAEKAKAMLAGQSLESLAKRIAESLEEMMADPHIQQRAKQTAGQKMKVKTDSISQEQAKSIAEQVEAMMADPHLHNEAKHIFEDIGMMSDQKFAQHTRNAIQQKEGIVRNLKFLQSDKAIHDLHGEKTKVYADQAPVELSSSTQQLVGNLIGRALKSSPIQHTDLERTTSRKQDELAMPVANLRRRLRSATRSTARRLGEQKRWPSLAKAEAEAEAAEAGLSRTHVSGLLSRGRGGWPHREAVIMEDFLELGRKAEWGKLKDWPPQFSGPQAGKLHGQTFDVGEVRRIERASMLAWAFAAASLTAVFTLPEKWQGWAGAAGAVLTFGSSSPAGKHPAAAAAGPLGFQLWVTVGNILLNMLLILISRKPIQWNGWGAIGAATLTATQVFAWPALQRLGAAAGPGIWCGISMVTSYMWGISVFGEKMASPVLAAAAIGILVLGAGGVGASQVLANHRQAKTPSARKKCSCSMMCGLLCTIITGLLDGSLMVAFSAYKKSPLANDLGPHAVVLQYLGSFALGLPVIALPALIVALAIQGSALSKTVPLKKQMRSLLAAAGPGINTGGLWAVGNMLSIHATMRLGQAVGYPLSQSCIVVSALWGIFYLREMRDPAALGLFAASGAVVLAGAAALKLGGIG